MNELPVASWLKRTYALPVVVSKYQIGDANEPVLNCSEPSVTAKYALAPVEPPPRTMLYRAKNEFALDESLVARFDWIVTIALKAVAVGGKVTSAFLLAETSVESTNCDRLVITVEPIVKPPVIVAPELSTRMRSGWEVPPVAVPALKIKVPGEAAHPPLLKSICPPRELPVSRPPPEICKLLTDDPDTVAGIVDGADDCT